MAFTDRVELFVPPRKGRHHVTRLIGQLLGFKPRDVRTDIGHVLDTLNRVLKRRSVIFLVSDFLADTESYRRALIATNQRHDVVAIDLNDPMETEIADVGLLALEDAETGALSWIDTGSGAWRTSFEERARRLEAERSRTFASARVDRVRVGTDRDYLPGLVAFFRKRARRLARRSARSNAG